MSKYIEFDRKLLWHVERGVGTFAYLVAEMYEPAMELDTGSGPDRVVDRRLQALRKADLIRYSLGRWERVR